MQARISNQYIHPRPYITAYYDGFLLYIQRERQGLLEGEEDWSMTRIANCVYVDKMTMSVDYNSKFQPLNSNLNFTYIVYLTILEPGVYTKRHRRLT